MMEKCPCGSKQNYTDCCAVFLEGKAEAETAEQLMRSRYTAHVKCKIDYIINTVHPSTRKNSNREAIELWAERANWLGLEVLNTQKGGKDDAEGKVSFKAYYNYDNQIKNHSENSTFKKEQGRWYYLAGKMVQNKIKSTTKLGRNEPCYCGSGKKFKKCCGKR